MDPPYMVRPKSWGYGDYIDETRKARAFCSAVIDCGSCGYWLFDAPCSDLVQLALDAGSVLMECTGTRNRQRANEVMCVRNPSLLMDFAISGKTDTLTAISRFSFRFFDSFRRVFMRVLEKSAFL